MHARRLACFFLGLWLAGGLLLTWTARQNLQGVGRLFSGENPNATLRLKPLGPEAHSVLEYLAREQNRANRRQWEIFQIFFATLFFLVMLFGSRENKFVLLGVLVALAVVALQRFLITPETDALGHMLDFAPQDQMGPERNRLWVLERTAFGVEAGKWVLLLFLTGQMVFSRRRSGRSRDTRRELNRVNKPDYRRVNW